MSTHARNFKQGGTSHTEILGRLYYATGRLEHSGRQKDDKMSCKIGNTQSRTTCFSSFKVTPSQRMPNCVTIDAKNILHSVYTQNSSKAKQNKTKHSRLHY